ncbi:MAG: hypothetical protein ABSC19_03870 [Syntrophorhabdales bacterium]
MVAFLVIFASATVFAFQMRPSYEAKSVLLIKVGREFLHRPEAVPNSEYSVPLDAITRGEISILTSHDLIGRVVRTIGPENLYPDLAAVPGAVSREQAAMGRFEKGLKVATPGPSLLEVTFTHGDSNGAALAVNTLVSAFKDKHLEVFGGKSTEFLESQEKASQERLRESEGKLAGFKERNRIFSLAEQKTALLDQRASLDTDLKAAQNQISELEQKGAFVRGQKWVAAVPTEIKTQLAALQSRERELLAKHTDTSKTVQNVRQEIQAMKDSITKDSEEVRQADIAKAESELTMVRARAESLKDQVQQVDGEIHFLESRDHALQDLQRDVAMDEQNYQTYARKVEESLIMDDMDKKKMVAISVIEKAIPSLAPKKRKLDRNGLIAAGFFGGVAGGLALAFVLELMTPGMTTPLSAEKRLGLPVLTAIAKKG